MAILLGTQIVFNSPLILTIDDCMLIVEMFINMNILLRSYILKFTRHLVGTAARSTVIYEACVTKKDYVHIP